MKGKLPPETLQIEYELEYRKDILEINKDAVKPGQRIAIIDDLLVTGGTIDAVAKLVELAGGEVSSLAFVIELTELNGKVRLEKYDVFYLVKYDI